MTRFTVVWHPDAQNELAELWMAAPDRSTIAAAADLIDLELSQDAENEGIHIVDGLRAFHSPPLRVLFAVREDDRIVEVLRVRRL